MVSPPDQYPTKRKEKYIYIYFFVPDHLKYLKMETMSKKYAVIIKKSMQ